MIKKLLIGFTLFIAIVVVGVRFGVPYWADAKVRDIISSADSASFTTLDIDVWQGNAVIENLYFVDTSGTFSEQHLSIEVDKAEIKGFDLWRAYKDKVLIIKLIEIGNGQIQLPLAPQDSNEAAEIKPKPLPINSISIGEFMIDSLAAKVYLNTENDEEGFAGVLALDADSINIPLNSDNEISYGHLNALLTHVYAQPKNSIAYFETDSIRLNGTKGKLSIYKAKMRQRLKESNYASYFGFDKDYITLDVYTLKLSGLPKKLTSLNEGLRVKRIDVQGVQAYFFKDRRLPHPATEKKFIIESLSELELPIRIDTVNLVDGQLYFNENWRDDFVPGRIMISDMKASMYNLSNQGPTEVGDWFTINGAVNLYSKFKLDVDWRFDLKTEGKAFTLDINMGSTAFATLNPFTENTVGARFKSGYLNSGRLFVEGNKTSGAGTLDLYYSNLKFKLLDRQTHHQNVIDWAGGGIANLVVKNNNKKGKKAKTGIVYTEPLKDRAIFGYVMKLFFSGFKDIALTSKNKQKAAERGFEYLEMPYAVKLELANQNAKKAKAELKKTKKEGRN